MIIKESLKISAIKSKVYTKDNNNDTRKNEIKSFKICKENYNRDKPKEWKNGLQLNNNYITLLTKSTDSNNRIYYRRLKYVVINIIYFLILTKIIN